MSYTLIGDLHLNSNSPDYLYSQLKLLDNLLLNCSGYNIIFLGDIFHYRNPKALEVIEFKKLLDKHEHKEFVLLRGNHDTIDRSNTSRTILEVFASKNVDVIAEPKFHEGIYYIPHYEDDDRILNCLKSAEQFSPLVVVGHFGYKGLQSPEGYDSTEITELNFTLPTVLGHIHSFRQIGNITVLGVPYATSFAENNSNHYFMEVDRYWKYPKIVEINRNWGGPAFYSISENDLDSFNPNPNQLNYVNVLSKVMNTTEISSKLSNKVIKKFTVVPVQPETKHSFYWKGNIADLPTYVDDCETELDKNKLKKIIEEKIKLLGVKYE